LAEPRQRLGHFLCLLDHFPFCHQETIIMKPEIIISTQDMDRLEGLLSAPSARSRSDLDPLRAELDRADVREPADMPDNVIMMNSRARFLEENTGREYELTLTYPRDASTEASHVSIFSPAGSALIGLATGQSIDWKTPDGKPIRLKVLAVNQAAITDQP
jgi:regulator of nucleoside diphosphate kinase